MVVITPQRLNSVRFLGAIPAQLLPVVVLSDDRSAFAAFDIIVANHIHILISKVPKVRDRDSAFPCIRHDQHSHIRIVNDPVVGENSTLAQVVKQHHLPLSGHANVGKPEYVRHIITDPVIITRFDCIPILCKAQERKEHLAPHIAVNHLDGVYFV